MRLLPEEKEALVLEERLLFPSGEKSKSQRPEGTLGTLCLLLRGQTAGTAAVARPLHTCCSFPRRFSSPHVAHIWHLLSLNHPAGKSPWP